MAAVEGELPSLRRSGTAGASGGHLSKVGAAAGRKWPRQAFW